MAWSKVIIGIVVGPWLAGPAQKAFKPCFPLPRLVNYNGGASAKYLEKFPTNRVQLGRALIAVSAVRAVASRVGCGYLKRLERACKILETGADIGCRGPARAASFSKNAASAVQCGYQVSDAVASWIQK